MLANEELADVLALGHEVRGVEFKGVGSPRDRGFLAKVTRAALGLCNRRGGGYVVIGIDDTNPAAGGPGLDSDQVAEWTNYDHLATWFGLYADPAFEFEVDVRPTPQGNSVVVLEIREFDDIPVLCKREYTGVLKRGALYTRSRGRPETSDTHDHSELREVIELATEKSVRRFLQTAGRAGVDLSSSIPAARSEASFDAQLGDF